MLMRRKNWGAEPLQDGRTSLVRLLHADRLLASRRLFGRLTSRLFDVRDRLTVHRRGSLHDRNKLRESQIHVDQVLRYSMYRGILDFSPRLSPIRGNFERELIPPEPFARFHAQGKVSHPDLLHRAAIVGNLDLAVEFPIARHFHDAHLVPDQRGRIRTRILARNVLSIFPAVELNAADFDRAGLITSCERIVGSEPRKTTRKRPHCALRIDVVAGKLPVESGDFVKDHIMRRGNPATPIHGLLDRLWGGRCRFRLNFRRCGCGLRWGGRRRFRHFLFHSFVRDRLHDNSRIETLISLDGSGVVHHCRAHQSIFAIGKYFTCRGVLLAAINFAYRVRGDMNIPPAVRSDDVAVTFVRVEFYETLSDRVCRAVVEFNFFHRPVETQKGDFLSYPGTTYPRP